MFNYSKRNVPPESSFKRFLPVSLLILCLFFGELLKLPLIEQLTTRHIGENEVPFGLLALKHDLIIFAGFLSLFLLSLFMRKRLVSATIRFISLLIVFLWMLDILALNFFTTRLSTNDLIKFSGQWTAVRAFVFQIFSDQTWLLILAFTTATILILLYLFTKAIPAPKSFIGVLTILIAGLILVYQTEDTTSYVHAWTYQNVFEINLKQSISNQFSADYIRTLEDTSSAYEERTDCIDGQNQRINIVVLLFESLSMYHSQTFSGLPTMAPNFDRIAKENTVYTNFFSNGFTTEAALVSLFTGKHMLPPTSGYATESWDPAYFYRGFHKSSETLPELFNKNSYHTAFITTGDLGFLNKGDWLKALGFKHIEGAENPYYIGWPRLHFDAAPDEALYDRALQFLDDLENQSPYFIVIETVSTHQPFYNPESHSRDEASVFLMADKALGDFYDILSKKDFFNNGMLVILGDHRSMTALREEELSLYGASSASRVPMVIINGNKKAPQKINTMAQQTDFIPSFDYLVGEQSCTGPLTGNFLSDPPIEASHVIFPRGDNRNLVDVYSKEGEVITINLDGDRTSVIDGMMNNSEGLIHYINKERLRITRSEEILPVMLNPPK